MPALNDPDAQLMLRVKDGDVEAFEMLVESYKGPVINLIYRNLKDRAEAEDLAQNVFVQAYKSAARYQPTAKFSTWLFTIARNLCLNEIRRRSRHPAFSLDQALDGDDSFMPQQFEDRSMSCASTEAMENELIRKIDEALSDLPENQRTAVTLYRNRGLSYEEVSEVLGCSLSATKSLIHRAREILRIRLKDYLRTGEWVARPEAPQRRKERGVEGSRD